MNNDSQEWAQKASDILSEYPGYCLDIPVKDIHVLICGALIASEDKRQTDELREIVYSIAVKCAISLTNIIPEMEEIYSAIPIAITDEEKPQDDNN